MVAGDALSGGDTRLDIYRAMVEGSAGRCGVMDTDLEKVVNLCHAL